MSPESREELDALRSQVAIMNRKLDLVLEKTGMKDVEIESLELQELTAQCMQTGDYKLNAVKAYLREKNAKKGRAA